jgi:hypothetical protein
MWQQRYPVAAGSLQLCIHRYLPLIVVLELQATMPAIQIRAALIMMTGIRWTMVDVLMLASQNKGRTWLVDKTVGVNEFSTCMGSFIKGCLGPLLCSV